MLKLMYITNKPSVASIAEKAGVDRIFIDLETIDKAKRQGGMDTVQSHHTLNDVAVIRQTLTKADLLVRSNHMHVGSKTEIDTIIRNGAAIVMLPYFKTVNEVAKFIDLIDERAKVCLLVETPEAVDKIDAILELEGIDEIHIGLNDLHLAYGLRFMFEVLTNGTVERLADKFQAKGIPFGFGGIARLKAGALPAEAVIKEHYRLGSSMAILSRSFCNTDIITDLEEIQEVFMSGIKDIRNLEKEVASYKDYFESNHLLIEHLVSDIANR